MNDRPKGRPPFFRYMSPGLLSTVIIFNLLLARWPLAKMAQLKSYVFRKLDAFFEWGTPDIPRLEVDFTDKLAHFFIFFVFSLLFVWGLRRQKRYAVWAINAYSITFVCALLLGGATEILQSLLTNYRSGDWYDLMFDMLGTSLALAVAKLFSSTPKRKQSLI